MFSHESDVLELIRMDRECSAHVVTCRKLLDCKWMVTVTNPYLLSFTLYLIFILSYHIMWSIPWLDMWPCHMTSMMHSFIFLTCVLHVFLLLHIPCFFIYDRHASSSCCCATHVLLAFNTCSPSLYHMFTLCLPGCCLEDASIYSVTTSRRFRLQTATMTFNSCS